jgi:hypothetical protein
MHIGKILHPVILLALACTSAFAQQAAPACDSSRSIFYFLRRAGAHSTSARKTSPGTSIHTETSPAVLLF